MACTPEIEHEIKDAWENSDLTARQIGEKFRVTKNVVLGLAHRRGWKARQENRIDLPYRHTTSDRLDALHAKMDRVLKECVGVGRITEIAGD